MQYHYTPQDPHDDEQRQKAREKLRGNPIGDLLGIIIVPGIVGTLASIVICIVIPGIMSALTYHYSVNRAMTKIMQDLDQDFSLIMAFKFGQTKLGAILLFGFLAGIGLKKFYGDEKV